jgi:hypothetical protein
MTIWAWGSGQGARGACAPRLHPLCDVRVLGWSPSEQGWMGAVCPLVLRGCQALGRALWASWAGLCAPPSPRLTVCMLPWVLPVTPNGDVGYKFGSCPLSVTSFPVSPFVRSACSGDAGSQFALPREGQKEYTTQVSRGCVLLRGTCGLRVLVSLQNLFLCEGARNVLVEVGWGGGQKPCYSGSS